MIDMYIPNQEHLKALVFALSQSATRESEGFRKHSFNTKIERVVYNGLEKEKVKDFLQIALRFGYQPSPEFSERYLNSDSE